MPSIFRRALFRPPAPAPVPTADPAAIEAGASEDDHTPHCGWFDSSHDLQAGLLVQEHASADAVLCLLALDDWLQLQLAGWQPRVAEARH